jgi:hypothetical protein
MLAGGFAGAMYPLVQSNRREPFIECVGAASLTTTLGMLAGFGAAHFHPILAASLIFGGPTWAYQRLRFPDEEAIAAAKADAKVKEKLETTFAAQDSLAKQERDAIVLAQEIVAKEQMK